jgi:general stress protein 26
MSTERFWQEIQDIRTLMMAVGEARHVPMTANPIKDDGRIWFVGAAGTDIVKQLEVGEGRTSMIVSGEGNLQARIEGHGVISNDRAKLEELWNTVTDAWFDGIDDPDVRLIEVTPMTAELWISPGSLGFIIGMAKAKMSGEQPDIGEHLIVTL